LPARERSICPLRRPPIVALPINNLSGGSESARVRPEQGPLGIASPEHDGDEEDGRDRRPETMQNRTCRSMISGNFAVIFLRRTICDCWAESCIRTKG